MTNKQTTEATAGLSVTHRTMRVSTYQLTLPLEVVEMLRDFAATVDGAGMTFVYWFDFTPDERRLLAELQHVGCIAKAYDQTSDTFYTLTDVGRAVYEQVK